jgi:ABC-2 type transport system ATP-binding protein
MWDEVRRVNRDSGVTIFLTTQYLEEADALADRIGIINHGVLVAEGTPADLKRTIGSDVIVARIDGDPQAARAAVEAIDAVERVDVYNEEISICVANGAGFVSTVALALNASNVRVRELTLRTPTLDDVFLNVTGARLQQEEAAEEGAEGVA